MDTKRFASECNHGEKLDLPNTPMTTYVPAVGDVCTFPIVGAQLPERPWLVLSSAAFNSASAAVLGCAVVLPSEGSEGLSAGAIRDALYVNSAELRSHSLLFRRAEFLGRVSESALDAILQTVRARRCRIATTTPR